MREDRDNIYHGVNSTDKRAGVIAVLFLFVVAFVFGAISLSMQTGQVVERRIKTDQAADSAVFALASKSAQGLNFIAANNLAIAGASHMAGVLHIVADWIILIKLLYTADCYQQGQFNGTEYDSIYNWFRPVAKIYFRSATGLTSLNSFIATTFPIVGLVDAVSVGSANLPGSIIVPFGAKVAGMASLPSTASANFMERLKTAVKDAVKNISPTYDGLKRINSDETFCLAYKAGNLGVKDWEELSDWFTGDMAPNTTVPPGARTALRALLGLVNVAAGLIDKIGILGKLVRFRVGFSACGFGDTGKFSGGGPKDSRMIADFLKLVLTGPMSGRVGEIANAAFCPAGQKCAIHPARDVHSLASEVNGKTGNRCESAQNKGQWASYIVPLEGVKLRTSPEPGDLTCVYKKNPPVAKKYPRNDNHFHPGQKITTDGPADVNSIFLWDYDSACAGTILFEWAAYSGLQFDVARDSKGIPLDPATPSAKPAPSSPTISATDSTSNLCPNFVANDARGQVPLEFDTKLSLTREKPFVEEILNRLKYDEANPDSDAPLLPNVPAPGISDEIVEYFNCAQNVPNACPFGQQSGRGYFEDKKGNKFYPDMDQLNWLCPLDNEDPTKSIIRQTLSFQPTLFASRFHQLEQWHNDRVNDYIKSMKCDEYRKFNYKNQKPRDPTPPQALDTGPHASNNYCGDNQHMCWQRNMQKQVGKKLKEGNLSFTVPAAPISSGTMTPLEASLQYGVVTISPLRIDNSKDITPRNDGSVLSHCPPHMDVTVQLQSGGQISVCDIQPVIGFIARMVKDDNGQESALAANTDFGLGNANLASGGGIEVGSSGAIGTSGFMAISQAGVSFVADPTSGDPPLHDNDVSKAKTYQLFWPSWRPRVLPARIMSRLLPSAISPLVED